MASNADALERISSPTSASRMVARESARLAPNTSLIGPRAHAITAGTS
jgi:hypothetical protein